MMHRVIEGLTLMMENLMEKKMEHEMETGIMCWILPPVMNSWTILIILFYRVHHMTLAIDC